MVWRRLCMGMAVLALGIVGCGEDPPASGVSGALGLGPCVRILLPPDSSAYTPGDTIVFDAAVADIKDAAELLDVLWSSDLDGALNSSPADSAGRCGFQSAVLSQGRHAIALEVTDRDGNSTTSRITVHNEIPLPCQLLSATSDYSQVHLAWSQADTLDFAQYVVRRSTVSGVTSEDEIIAVMSSISDTTFQDTNITFEPAYYYRVFLESPSGYSSGSNEVAVHNPAGLTFEAGIFDALCHPTEPWLYILDRDQLQLFCVDYETMAPRDSMTFLFWPGYFDIGDNGFGVELTIPVRDYKIHIYDAGTLEEVLLFGTDVRDIFAAIIDFRGHIIASLEPYAFWDIPLRVYARDTGGFIDGDGDRSNVRPKLLNSGLEIITISSGASPEDMDYFRLNEAGEIIEHVSDTQHGSHPMSAAIFQIDPSGRYLVTAASGELYRADETMEHLGTLPADGAEFGDFAFSAGGDTIYAGCSNTTEVRVYTYPELSQLTTLHTRGPVEKLWRIGSRLLIAVRINEYDRRFGLQFLDLSSP